MINIVTMLLAHVFKFMYSKICSRSNQHKQLGTVFMLWISNILPVICSLNTTCG